MKHPSTSVRTCGRSASEMDDVHQAVEHVAGPTRLPPRGDAPIVVSLMRDAEVYIEAFIHHYRRLGCEHIVLLDNGSTDRTVDRACADRAVTVLRAALPFADYKRPMRRYLSRRFSSDRWCLCVDIDEFFDYPGSDTITIGEFLRYLERHDFTAVVAQMLDLFPARLTSGLDTSGKSFRRHDRFYDLSAVERRPYVVTDNQLPDPPPHMYFGGIRKTLFGFAPWLTKHPLFFCDERIVPFAADSHCVQGARVADVTAVLYHYKFAGDFLARVARAVREGNYYRDSLEYRHYDKVLRVAPRQFIRRPSSRELRAVSDLIDCGFLVVSDRFSRYVARLRCRKSSPRR